MGLIKTWPYEKIQVGVVWSKSFAPAGWGAGGYGGGELVNEHFIGPTAGTSGRVIIFLAKAAYPKTYRNVAIASNKNYKLTAYPTPEWEGINGKRDWTQYYANSVGSALGLHFYFDKKDRSSANWSTRTFDTSPFTIHNDLSGDFVEFKTLDDLSMGNGAPKLFDTRIYPVGGDVPLRIPCTTDGVGANIFYGMEPHEYGAGTYTLTIKGPPSASKKDDTVFDPYVYRCYIVVQGAGGGGGGADSDYGIWFNYASGGGGGGGGGAGLVEWVPEDLDTTYTLTITVGSGGKAGSNGTNSTSISGGSGGDSVVTIKKGDTTMCTITGKGGGGGGRGINNDAGGGGSNGTFYIDNKSARVYEWFSVRGGKGGTGGGGAGHDMAIITDRFNGNPGTRTLGIGGYNFMVQLIGGDGANSNNEGDTGGSGGGSWWGQGGEYIVDSAQYV